MSKNNGYKHFSIYEGDVDIFHALCTVKVGDLIKVNEWRQSMKVKCVSANYFVMTANRFGKIYYSVVSKKPWNGTKHNSIVGGMCHCGTDNWVFGSPLVSECEKLYDFNDELYNKLYLDSFEKGKCELSHRTSVAIFDLYIKPAKEKSKVLEYIKTPQKPNNAVNRMGCSESWYNPYYAIKETFSLEEVQAMSEREVENLVKLAWNISEGLY